MERNLQLFDSKSDYKNIVGDYLATALMEAEETGGGEQLSKGIKTVPITFPMSASGEYVCEFRPPYYGNFGSKALIEYDGDGLYCVYNEAGNVSLGKYTVMGHETLMDPESSTMKLFTVVECNADGNVYYLLEKNRPEYDTPHPLVSATYRNTGTSQNIQLEEFWDLWMYYLEFAEGGLKNIVKPIPAVGYIDGANSVVLYNPPIPRIVFNAGNIEGYIANYTWEEFGITQALYDEIIQLVKDPTLEIGDLNMRFKNTPDSDEVLPIDIQYYDGPYGLIKVRGPYFGSNTYWDATFYRENNTVTIERHGGEIN